MTDVPHELRDVGGVPAVWLLGDHIEDVVGESHYQSEIESVVGPKTPDGHDDDVIAWLRPEPDNAHDPNAVAVMLKSAAATFAKCGHLPRELAVAWQPLLVTLGATNGGRPVLCAGTVRGGWSRGKKSGERSVGSFGVKVDVPTIAEGRPRPATVITIDVTALARPQIQAKVEELQAQLDENYRLYGAMAVAKHAASQAELDAMRAKYGLPPRAPIALPQAPPPVPASRVKPQVSQRTATIVGVVLLVLLFGGCFACLGSSPPPGTMNGAAAPAQRAAPAKPAAKPVRR